MVRAWTVEGYAMAENDTGGASEDGMDSRARLDLLLEKTADDPHPSGALMDPVEQLPLPDNLPAYAAVLKEKIRGDAFSSVPMMKHLVEITDPA
jgi:hypothetical protein